MAGNSPDPGPSRIYLTYRRDDAGGVAPGLYGLLAQRFGKKRVRWDVEVLRAVRWRSYSAYLGRRLKPDDVVVLLIGRRWASATDDGGRRLLDDPKDAHRHELEVAFARKSIVIPVLLPGAEMPAPDELPPSLHRLGEIEAHELTERRYLADLTKLIHTIERVQSPQAERGAQEAGQSADLRAREETLVTVARERAARGELETAGQTAALIEDAGRRGEALSSIADAIERRDAVAEQPLLRLPLPELLRNAGLKYAAAGDTLAVSYLPEHAEQLVVTAKMLGSEEGLAVFAVDLASPAKLKEAVARNLLRVSFDADYTKAILTGEGQVRLAAELPAEVLTASVARGLVDGLSRLGDVKSGDLKSEQSWRERLDQSDLVQGLHIGVDHEKTREAIPEALTAAGLEVDEIAAGVVATKLTFRATGERFPVAVRPRQRAISLIAYTPLKPKGDETEFMLRLLELNGVVHVARVGLDNSGEIALLYEVPALYPTLIDHVRAQFDLLLFGVLSLEPTS